MLIQTHNKNHVILNSRSEYNRCALPRLTAKMGDEAYDKIDKIKKDEKLAEAELERKIRDLKRKEGKKRKCRKIGSASLKKKEDRHNNVQKNDPRRESPGEKKE